MSESTTPPLAPWLGVQRDRLLAQRGHAWLLQGASGLGQYELALSLVRAWLCDAPQPHGACGQCSSCHAIDVRTHADLCVLMPETVMLESGWPLTEKAQQEIDDKKRKASREIRVDALRDAVEFSQRTSARGRGKAVLVYPAERMNTISANTLLKTLEEPPGDVKFVLASEAAHLLLPTIRSRCLGHSMAWPTADQALDWLVGQGVEAGDAPVLLRAAGGRPNDALRDWTAGRRAKAWALLPKAVARGDASALAALLRQRRPARHALAARTGQLVQGADGRQPDRRAPVQCRADAGIACERSPNRPKLTLKPMSNVPSTARPSVIQLAIKEKAALYAAYIPLFAEGGIFIPTTRDYRLGDDVYVLLSLPEDPQRYPVAGKVAWITPGRASGSRTQGVGIRFPQDEKSRQLKLKIEEVLGGALASDRPTQTI